MSFLTKTKYLTHRGVQVGDIMNHSLKKETIFEDAGLKERWALGQIFPKIIGEKEHFLSYTPPYSYTKYDALLQFLNNGSLKHTYIIEAKIREKHYPELMLENKKYNDLQNSILHEGNTTLMYIVFTPEGTYIYNLSKITLPKITLIECPVKTLAECGSKMKQVYLLPLDLAKKIDFIYTESDYKKSTLQSSQQKSTSKGPFDDLFIK